MPTKFKKTKEMENNLNTLLSVLKNENPNLKIIIENLQHNRELKKEILEKLSSEVQEKGTGKNPEYGLCKYFEGNLYINLDPSLKDFLCCELGNPPFEITRQKGCLFFHKEPGYNIYHNITNRNGIEFWNLEEVLENLLTSMRDEDLSPSEILDEVPGNIPSEKLDERPGNIHGINKAELLAALYNQSKPMGLGFFHADVNKVMTNETAQRLLEKSTYFDYLQGRVMKVDLSGNELNTRLYRDNGEGSAEWIINALRNQSSLVESGCSTWWQFIAKNPHDINLAAIIENCLLFSQKWQLDNFIGSYPETLLRGMEPLTKGQLKDAIMKGIAEKTLASSLNTQDFSVDQSKELPFKI